jgi:hypothetical protein
MQKRKNRIEQWRAERRTMLGIDKAMQQSISQAAKVRNALFNFYHFCFRFKCKAWSLEDEGDDDEEDPQNVVNLSTDLKLEVASAREAALSLQTDKHREAMERAAEAAALAAAACANLEKEEEEEEDPLEKFMENIAKEVKSFRGNNATIISKKTNGSNTTAVATIKQEQLTNKGSVIKVITKTVKSEVRIKCCIKL